MSPGISRVTIGTRGSALALHQTDLVKKALLGLVPDLEVAVEVIATTGDRDGRPIPLDVVGKGWFSKEIESGLQSGAIDLAVHSLKDLPEKLADGLIIGAVLEREDPRDVLVLKNNKSLDDLPAGAIIGTDSIRRRVQLLALRPDLTVESIRGNVPTRLEKLKDGHYDGIMLAAAGLHRLGLKNSITQYFEPYAVMPAPGQGALAVEIKADRRELVELIRRIDHAPTSTATQAERTFSAAVGGGCKKPVGALAILEVGTREKGTLCLSGLIGSDTIVRGSLSGDPDKPKELGKQLAAELLKKIDGSKT